MSCSEKKKYDNRMAAEAALYVARSQWRLDPSRAPRPPVKVYLCDQCSKWHLTHKLRRAAA